MNSLWRALGGKQLVKTPRSARWSSNRRNAGRRRVTKQPSRDRDGDAMTIFLDFPGGVTGW